VVASFAPESFHDSEPERLPQVSTETRVSEMYADQTSRISQAEDMSRRCTATSSSTP
jgi:hypothetical protein